MAAEHLDMDGICVWLERLLTWIDRAGAPAVVYVGRPGGGYRNPPAPHIELAWLQQGGFDDLAIGPLRVRFPEGHIAAHNVHLGNRTPRLLRCVTWCAFFDVAAAPAFAPLARTPWFGCLPAGDEPSLEAAFARLQAACSRHGDGRVEYLDGRRTFDPESHGLASPTAPYHVKIAALDLVLQFYDRAIAQEWRPRPGEAPPVRRALELIRSRLTDPALDLSAIARAAGVTPTHLGRQFHRALGRTPMQHLQHLRIENARLRLASGDEPIATIASAVGLPDPFHFSRVFRRICGCSPSAWRRTNHSGRE